MDVMKIEHATYFSLHQTHVVRFRGFVECIKLFHKIDSKNSSVWNKFINLIKNFVTENHELTREKGLEAALIFIEKASCAVEIVNEIVPEVIKCFISPKEKIKNLSIKILLMFIKIGQYKIVEKELLIGTDSKNIEIIASCISTLTKALQQFDSIDINSKIIIKKLPEFLNYQDETIHWKVIELIVELYRLFSSDIIKCLDDIKGDQQCTLIELKHELLKLDNTNYICSTQNKNLQNSTVHDDDDDGDGDGDGNDDEQDDCGDVDVDRDSMNQVDDEYKENIYEDHQEILNDFRQDNRKKYYQDNSVKNINYAVIDTNDKKLHENRQNIYINNHQMALINKSYQNTKSVDVIDQINDNIEIVELTDSVDILSHISFDFHIRLLNCSYFERRNALYYLNHLIKDKNLESGLYIHIIGSLNCILLTDTCPKIIILAAKCLAGLANGLKQRFHIHSGNCLLVVLNKFSDTRSCVVAVLRDTADAIYQSMNIDSILEVVIIAMRQPNPSIKSETAGFISRCLTNTPATSLNNNLLKIYIHTLLSLLIDQRAFVRNSGIETLGKLMGLVGEQKMMPYLNQLHSNIIYGIKKYSKKN